MTEPAVASATGAVSNAAVALANFVYTIVKDTGAEVRLTTRNAGPGVSNVPPDVPVRIIGQYEHGGVWYTHTRAWHSVPAGRRTHDGITTAEEFHSVYLCIVFPFRATYSVAVPDLEELSARLAKLRVEITELKLSTRTEIKRKLAELPVPEKGYVSRSGPDDRGKRQLEADQRYDREMAEYAETKRLIEELGAAHEADVAAREQLYDRQRQLLEDLRAGHQDVQYISNFHIESLDEWNGVTYRSWQNVKVDATLDVRAEQAEPGRSPGVSVHLAWNERVPGYGRPWGGTVTFRAGTDELTGAGKFLSRFRQFAVRRALA